MAKFIKKKDFNRENLNVIRDNIEKYNTSYELLKDLFDEPVENVYMILFAGNKAVSLQKVSKATGTASSVEIDMDLIDDTFKKIDGTGVSYAMSHNHPYHTDSKGEWVETLISDADVLSTKNITTNQELHYPDISYRGHFVVNKEMNDIRKIIFFDDERQFKYTKEVINLIKEGEI